MTKAQRVSAFRSAIEKIEEEQEQNPVDIISAKEVERPPSHDSTTVSEVDNISQPANNIEQDKPINFDILDIFNEKLNKFLVTLIKNT